MMIYQLEIFDYKYLLDHDDFIKYLLMPNNIWSTLFNLAVLEFLVEFLDTEKRCVRVACQPAHIYFFCKLFHYY